MVLGCAEGEVGGPPAATCSEDSECLVDQRCDVVAGVCRDVPDMSVGMEDMAVAEPEDMRRDAPDLPTLMRPDFGQEEPDLGQDLGGMVDQGMPEDMGSGVDMNVPEDMGSGVDMMVDPCLSVTCAPKDNECSGDFLVSYGGGVCDDGACTYAETRTDCAAMGNRKCENGACVDRECDPACEAPGVCDQGSCSFPLCAAEGDACEPLSGTDQGDFLCLIDNQATSEAHCFSKCDEDGASGGCATGQRCFAAVSNSPDLLICIDSECSSNADCSGGTCIKFENSFGYCEPGGVVPTGGTCEPASDQWCQQGNTCVTGSTGTGVCEAVCEPWGGTGCGASEYCALYTNRMGVCTSDQDATGQDAYDLCTTPGNYCADATVCITGSTDNFCVKYCRPGSADCAGIHSTVTCDNYVLPGERSLGICNVAACTTSTDCSTTADCVNGLCRQRCTAGTVAADCGSSSWSCVGGYCE